MTTIAGADETLDVEATDVIKIVLQWAKESGLEETHAAGGATWRRGGPIRNPPTRLEEK